MWWSGFGRGRGRGGWSGPWPGRGPFSYLPPWQRPGWMFGSGRGFGRGIGWSGNPYVCARYPGLPRGWWAYPGLYEFPGYGYGYTGYGTPAADTPMQPIRLTPRSNPTPDTDIK